MIGHDINALIWHPMRLSLSFEYYQQRPRFLIFFMVVWGDRLSSRREDKKKLHTPSICRCLGAGVREGRGAASHIYTEQRRC